MNDQTAASQPATGHTARPDMTAEELSALSVEEKMLAGTEADDIHVVYRQERYPVPGSKAEKRAERQVSSLFLLTFIGAIAFIVCYIVVPWKYKLGDNNNFRWFTPALGICLGVALLGLGFGMVLWAKKLMPEEEVVSDRHDGPSSEFDRHTTAATIVSGLNDSTLARRPMLRRSLGMGAGALGLMALFPVIGGLIKKPRGELFTTTWAKGVRLIQIDGTPVRPEDMHPGSLATVFPDVPGGTTASDTPTMLIRLRPDQKFKPRKGQESYAWGDYVAFSKICTHLGCPVSLYEDQTNRILCPCHQSQFDVLDDAKPVFGPASRPLPQLPITVNDEGYFVAAGPYREAIGPAFWERPNHV
jgi:ubiquinol-cytochrome c reductase iron-sulfur subunit